MAVRFHNQDVNFNIPHKNKIKAWVKSSLIEEGYILGEINVVFCSDESLLQMNEQYLKHNYYTDIITFEYSSRPVSGDLFISVDRINENAVKFGVSVSDEALRVIIHGVLHLCGYSDHLPVHKNRMREKEDYYLNVWQDI